MIDYQAFLFKAGLEKNIKREMLLVANMSDHRRKLSKAGQPLTSFLIEDILSVKDSARFNGKCCSQKMERFSEWEEESEKLSEQLSPLESTFLIFCLSV